MARISHVAGRQVRRRARKEQMQWLAMPLVRLLFLASAAKVMTSFLDLPLSWVLCTLFLATLANCMVSGLAEGGDSADAVAPQGPTFTYEAECLLRFLVVMVSVLTTLTVILLLLR